MDTQSVWDFIFIHSFTVSNVTGIEYLAVSCLTRLCRNWWMPDTSSGAGPLLFITARLVLRVWRSLLGPCLSSFKTNKRKAAARFWSSQHQPQPPPTPHPPFTPTRLVCFISLSHCFKTTTSVSPCSSTSFDCTICCLGASLCPIQALNEIARYWWPLVRMSGLGCAGWTICHYNNIQQLTKWWERPLLM